MPSDKWSVTSVPVMFQYKQLQMRNFKTKKKGRIHVGIYFEFNINDDSIQME